MLICTTKAAHLCSVCVDSPGWLVRAALHTHYTDERTKEGEGLLSYDNVASATAHCV